MHIVHYTASATGVAAALALMKSVCFFLLLVRLIRLRLLFLFFLLSDKFRSFTNCRNTTITTENNSSSSSNN